MWKSCVDSLPEYKAYQIKSKEIIQQYKKTPGAKSRRWKIEHAARLFNVVREGFEVDYYLFTQLFLKYPKALAFVSVMKT